MQGSGNILKQLPHHLANISYIFKFLDQFKYLIGQLDGEDGLNHT
jgi:hypothetical protein